MARTEEVQAIVDQYDLREYAATTLNIKRSKYGNRFHCFSQNHKNGDRDPSLVIYKDHFKCFGANCGIGGDIFELVKLVKGLDFRAAKSYLIGEGINPYRPKKTYPPKKEIKPPVKESRPSDTYLSFMADLWSLLKEKELSKEADKWLLSRRLSTNTAFEYGCREFSSAQAEVGRLLDSVNPEEVGFANPNPKDSEQKELWNPIKDLSRHRMLAIPSFIPKYDFPIQWRCRLYEPWNFKGKIVKTLAQYTLGKGIVPLGMRSQPLRNIVIICEGEPDFLSFREIAPELEKKTGFQINVIGICAIAEGWRPQWSPILSSADFILVAVHDNLDGKNLAAQVATNLVLSHGIEYAKVRVFRRLLGESLDANDLLKQGRLIEWFMKSMERAL